MKKLQLKNNKIKLYIAVNLCLLLALTACLMVFLPRERSAATVYATTQSQQAFVSRSTRNTDFTTGHFNILQDPFTTHRAPMITVLTHGLGGSVSHWSNTQCHRYFAFDSRSLIERLRWKNNASVFWARMQSGGTSFHLYNLPVQGQLQSYEYYDNGERRPNPNLTPSRHLTFNDINNHMVIVFEATQGYGGAAGGTNAAKYAEFRTMLLSIIRDFGYLTGGTYPRINLIGHSRGGLTNMQFANEFPRLVGNMFSLGTPFFGSNFGRVNYFTYQLGMYCSSNLCDVGECGSGLCCIQNEDLQLELKNNWNANQTNGRGSHINFYTMAGYSNLRFLQETVGQEWISWAFVGYQLLLIPPPFALPVAVSIASEIISTRESNNPNISNTHAPTIENAFYRAFSGWAFFLITSETINS